MTTEQILETFTKTTKVCEICHSYLFYNGEDGNQYCPECDWDYIKQFSTDAELRPSGRQCGRFGHNPEHAGKGDSMKLRELLALYNDKPQDVDLYHWDYDEESATMVDLSMKDFTEAGIREFTEVLNAEVVRVSEMGENWKSIYVTGVSSNDIKELSLSHAGYCSDENYRQWFTMDAE